MKKLHIIILLALTAYFPVSGQVNVSGHFYGEDAFKFSQYSNYGSSRTIGMGGAFTALGGDASNTFVNPAGLGFYNRSEFSVSPTFNNLSTSSTYLGEAADRNSSKATIGQVSLIMNKNRGGNSKVKSTLGVSYNTLANFYNNYDYTGSHNRSSLMDYFAEQATFRGADTGTLDSEFDPTTGIAATPESMYYQAYMIDPYEDGGYVVVEPSFPVVQKGQVSERGNLGQLNLSYGANYRDRVYFGAGIGIQSLNYNQISSHQETFPNGEVFNGFGYVDELVVKGSGINLTLGAIYKVTNDFRVGMNVTTPTAMRVNETFYSAISIDQKPNTFLTDFSTIETAPGDYVYKLTSPWRGNVGLAYLLPKKYGVVSLEAEYVGYGNMGVKDKNSNSWTNEQNTAIAQVYKDVVNIKGGLEVRLGRARVRGGVNYLADPYQTSTSLKRSNVILSGGAGFRSAKFFADAAFSASSFNSAYTPYVLSNPENYDSAVINNKVGTLSLTVGTFF